MAPTNFPRDASLDEYNPLRRVFLCLKSNLRPIATFKYADRIDPEAERIKDYAQVVNPTGAAKVTMQSLGIMIHVLNQILRTNAAMLKLQSEHLALQNRRGKLDSEQFKMQYEGVSDAFGQLKSNYELPRLKGN